MRLGCSAPLIGLLLVPAVSAGQPRHAAPDIFRKASPAIVTITTPEAFGSGVVIDPAGVIVTNLHVIRGADKAVVRLASGEIYESVDIVGTDSQKDLALLKIAGTALAAAEIGNSDEAPIGQTVYAIGAPKGLELTMSEGIVSGRRESPAGYKLIQTSAALSSGSSGGGLFDDMGRLIAITTSKLDDGENLNFSIPVNYVREIPALATPWSLAELNARLSAAHTGEGTSASPLTTVLASVPQLAKFYTNTDGEIAIVEQSTGGRVRVSFSSGGFTYGTAELQWDAQRHAFVGKRTHKALCGPDDPRVWDVSVEQELSILNSNVVRDRSTRPVTVDCTRRLVGAYAPHDTVWYVPAISDAPSR